MQPIATVVIGYGYSGRSFHCPLIRLVPSLNLVGVCSRDPETQKRIEAEQRCKVYRTFESVLSDPEIKLVILATPSYIHAEQAVAALKAGKHVVTDKALCLDLGQWQAMEDARVASGKVLSTFHNRRWDGDFITLRKLISTGVLGRVNWVEMNWQRFGPNKNWRKQRALGGGKLYDLGAHLIDQMLLLYPQKLETVYAAIRRDWPDADVESHSTLTLRFVDGSTGIMDTGSMTRRPKARMYVIGSEATFMKFGTDPQETALVAGDIDSAREDDTLYGRMLTDDGEVVVPTIAGRWRTYYEELALAIINETEPPVTMGQMKRVIGVLEAAFESEKQGQAIKVDL